MARVKPLVTNMNTRVTYKSYKSLPMTHIYFKSGCMNLQIASMNPQMAYFNRQLTHMTP